MLNRFKGLAAYRAVGVCIAAAWLAGCASESSRVGGAGQSAHLAVVNLTGYTWRVVFKPPGSAATVVTVDPHATSIVEIAGGGYAVEQGIEGGADNADQGPEAAVSRSFSATFESGQRYRWPLMTLNSEGDGSGDGASSGAEGGAP